MRFLANENFPGDAVTSLRAASHDVAWIRTDSPGASDRIVLERAVYEQRVLLTIDKDFGELAWRFGLPAQCGIVLLRVPMPSPRVVGKTIAQILVERSDWEGYFSVVEPGRIRMRPLPVSGG